MFHRRSGGSYHEQTGDGQVWHWRGDHLESGWFMQRPIKAGQWSGPWQRIRIADL